MEVKGKLAIEAKPFQEGRPEKKPYTKGIRTFNIKAKASLSTEQDFTDMDNTDAAYP